MGIDFIESFNNRVQRAYASRTGFIVDIQKIGKNTELIAVKETNHTQEIRPGVWLKKDAVTFRDGNFANRYDLSWNPRQIGIAPAIHSSNKPYSLYNSIKKDTSIIAAVNGSFYFLTDIADSKPRDLPYDFCIRNNSLFGLPSADDPILFVQDGALHTKEIQAKGVIEIAGKNIRWIGARSKTLHKKTANTGLLYNSNCATIIRVREKKTNVQIGILDNEHIHTPQNEGVYDIVVNRHRQNGLYVSHVIKGGGTHFHKGLFVIQLRGNTIPFAVGDRVIAKSLDGIKLGKITSGMTIGKRVGMQLSPERKHIRDARSVIAQDRKGYMHVVVFDGSKYVPGFHGVSAKEMTRFFPTSLYKWAYFLDGGGSSRMIIRSHRKLQILANQFAFIKAPNGMFLWDWRKARKIASSIALHIIQN